MCETRGVIPTPSESLRFRTVDGLAAVLVAVAFGCGVRTDAEGREPILVSAAASLTDAFAEVETAVEATHSDVDVVLNLGGSAALREQILEGAPADVFASASVENMGLVVASGGVSGSPQVFVHNLLQIAVPPGNPAGVQGLADFTQEALWIGLCARQVPCGEFGQRALERAGVAPSVDSHEPNVRALLTKIEAGEIDAGIVYVTDVTASGGGVHGIEISAAHNVVARYPIAVLTDAPNPEGAAAFVSFVLSGEGQGILRRHGFASP